MSLPEVNFLDADEVISVLEAGADAMEDSPLRQGASVRLPLRGTLLFSGDIHDYPGHLEAIVRLANLDESPDNHVILHELIHGERVFNGMDMSYRNLSAVAALVQRYPRQVHPILANHELAQCFRIAVSKGGGDQVAMFDAGLDYVFSDRAEEVATAIRDFIRAMPLVVRAENGVWCGHSIPAQGDFDRAIFDRPLEDADYLGPDGGAWRLVWGRLQDPAHVKALLAKFDAKVFLVGHCHAEMGIESPVDGLVVVNSDHDRGVVVQIDLAAKAPSARDIERSAIPLGLYRPPS
ncbi:MAG: hypothetical protein EXS03_03420 [Phycisphaerales bacterium]|nr:hypothetical protein [Phycisphaerales bacterium]